MNKNGDFDVINIIIDLLRPGMIHDDNILREFMYN